MAFLSHFLTCVFDLSGQFEKKIDAMQKQKIAAPIFPVEGMKGHSGM